ncbi:hypothetical protein BRC74_00970 [Halobacteriales archaeon QH_7_68_42]|nr:MAG: hypothetical protein BRC74_00970 [Halobacteriales archaeon QH_7_68_42]
MHSVLGRTPTDRGYVTGSGERDPQNPHSRLAASIGINVPGNVVGPNHDGGDPELDSLLSEDDPALDYAAPLVPLLTAVTPADAVGVE